MSRETSKDLEKEFSGDLHMRDLSMEEITRRVGMLDGVDKVTREQMLRPLGHEHSKGYSARVSVDQYERFLRQSKEILEQAAEKFGFELDRMIISKGRDFLTKEEIALEREANAREAEAIEKAREEKRRLEALKPHNIADGYIKRGDYEALKKLVDDNPALVTEQHEFSGQKSSLLYHFVNNEKRGPDAVDFMKYLLDKGADPNTIGTHRSVMRLAVGTQNTEAVKLLYKYGAKHDPAQVSNGSYSVRSLAETDSGLRAMLEHMSGAGVYTEYNGSDRVRVAQPYVHGGGAAGSWEDKSGRSSGAGGGVGRG